MSRRERSVAPIIALLALALCAPSPTAAQPAKGPVLVITASGRDYLFGAAGTLAKMIDEGRAVYVLQFGNDEKDSVGLAPADTRIANNEEGERAAKSLGVKEWLNLGHKSGELGQLSSSELRNQVMTMVRFYKPEIMFFPDWYIHYQDDNDVYRVGRMAEEAPYGGGSYFVQEMTYIGYGGFAAREYYYYSTYRPYRPREGGEARATIKGVDISNTFDRKLAAIAELKTGNRRYAVQTKGRLAEAGRSTDLLRQIDERSTLGLVRAFVEELAAAVGGKYGYKFGEEFNHLGTGGGIPEHIREKARGGIKSGLDGTAYLPRGTSEPMRRRRFPTSCSIDSNSGVGSTTRIRAVNACTSLPWDYHIPLAVFVPCSCDWTRTGYCVNLKLTVKLVTTSTGWPFSSVGW